MGEAEPCSLYLVKGGGGGGKASTAINYLFGVWEGSSRCSLSPPCYWERKGP